MPSAAEISATDRRWPVASCSNQTRPREKVETGLGEASDFRYIAANPAFAAQSGVGNVVGKTIREAFPGEPQRWFDTYDAVLTTGTPVRFELGLATQGRVLELYAFRIEDQSQKRVAAGDVPKFVELRLSDVARYDVTQPSMPEQRAWRRCDPDGRSVRCAGPATACEP